MPRVNIGSVPETNFEQLPTGHYLFRVEEVDNSKFDTATGTEKWKLTLKVVSNAGKNAMLWDHWAWKESGLGRIKYNLKKMGYDVSGEIDIMPEDIKGKIIYSKVELVKDSRDVTGLTMQSKIPWGGYQELKNYPDQNELAEVLKQFCENNANVPNLDNPDISLEDVPF